MPPLQVRFIVFAQHGTDLLLGVSRGWEDTQGGFVQVVQEQPALK
jgi:hypothetical protein